MAKVKNIYISYGQNKSYKKEKTFPLYTTKT